MTGGGVKSFGRPFPYTGPSSNLCVRELAQRGLRYFRKIAVEKRRFSKKHSSGAIRGSKSRTSIIVGDWSHCVVDRSDINAETVRRSAA
jgi:hypothetical protein